MTSSHWGRNRDPNLAIWDDLYWVAAQWLCQERGHSDDCPSAFHITNPAEYNEPCDWCYYDCYEVMEGLRELLQVFGSVAYSCGKHGVIESKAARRALRAVIERAREIEKPKELLAQLDPKGWWRLPLEPDERPQGL